MQNISYQSLYTNVLNLVFTKVVYLLRKQHVMGKFKKRHNGMTQTREPPVFDSS